MSKKKKKKKKKNTRTTVIAVGPCPTIIQISRTPRHWKFTQHHRTTRPSPNVENLNKNLKLMKPICSDKQRIVDIPKNMSDMVWYRYTSDNLSRCVSSWSSSASRLAKIRVSVKSLILSVNKCRNIQRAPVITTIFVSKDFAVKSNLLL